MQANPTWTGKLLFAFDSNECTIVFEWLEYNNVHSKWDKLERQATSCQLSKGRIIKKPLFNKKKTEQNSNKKTSPSTCKHENKKLQKYKILKRIYASKHYYE